MNKQKRRKTTPDYLEFITIKKLRLIILICIILSFFCEFFSDIINISDSLNDYIFIKILLSHKDFFVNISLGSLCSAVISYVILCISQRLKESEKKEIIEKYYIDIINECLYLNSAVLIPLDPKMSKGIDYFENVINSKSTYLKTCIEEFLYRYEDIEVCKTKYDVMKELCEKKLLPIITEINTFCVCLKELNIIERNLTENATKEVQYLLYDTLNNKYNFQSVIKDVLHILSEEHMPMKPLDDLVNILKKMSSDEKYLNIKSYYNTKLFQIVVKSSNEHMSITLKESKIQLMKYIDEHIDSLEYGSIIKVDGEKMYSINGKIVNPKEYREYCFNMELKKMGMDNIDI